MRQTRAEWRNRGGEIGGGVDATASGRAAAQDGWMATVWWRGGGHAKGDQAFGPPGLHEREW